MLRFVDTSVLREQNGDHQRVTFIELFFDLVFVFAITQFSSGTWKVEVATELAIWRATYRDALSMSTPSGYDAFHRKYVAALAKFDAAATKVADGIDSVDPGLIEDASADMDEGTRRINEAMGEFPG